MCMVFSSRVVALASFFTSSCALLTLPQPSLATIDVLSLPSEYASISVSPPANASVSSPAFRNNLTLDFLGPNDIFKNSQPVCNDMFGTNLNIRSCHDALDAFHDGTVPLRFGKRGFGYEVQLPRRGISPDGTCVIDIFPKDGVTYDFCTFRQILTAAVSVMIQCLRHDSNALGGYVRDIGNSQNLVVVVSAYRPTVTCFGSVGAARTMSQALIDAIPTDYTLQRFARLGVRAVDVVLPRTYYDPWAERPPYRFYVKIDTVAYTPVTGRWFDIWAATVAINALCVRNGRAGRARTEAGLVVRLDRKYESPGEVVSEGFNGSSSIIDAASS